MTVIREWAVGLCTAGIGCALLHLLCPSGTLQRAFRVLTAVFFFICLLSPLLSLPSVLDSLLPDMQMSEPDEYLSETVQDQMNALLDSALTAQASALLEPYGVIVKKAEAKRDTSRVDNIYIEHVTVTLDKQSFPAPREIYRVLEQAFQTRVEVQYVG